ncbi:MAG: hypothetical protein HY018_13035 [Hydrogenophilales bacterium]|nr:hypothetical protein [Hydrogenophilales bacterium]
MQRKALSVAIAAALSVAAGSASAALTYTSADTAVVNISGSSATNTQLKSWAANVLCSSDAITLTNDTNNFAVVCTPNASAITLPAGKTHVAVIKNSQGGSGNGIGPIANQTTVSFMNVFGTPTAGVYPVVNAIPDIGFSDEEPAVLIAAGATTGNASKVKANPLNVVTFGVPVTLSLRNALQQAQFGAGCVGSETEACMPSLSKQQLSSIFAGTLTDWTQLGLPSHVAADGTTDNNIYIARRVYSSGTQTGSRAFFLNDPCATSSGVQGFVAGDISTGDPTANQANYPETVTQADACNNTSNFYTTTWGVRVFEGSGSGNVEACVSNHERNGRWAISINSLEFPAVSSDTFENFAIGGGADQLSKLNNKDFQRHIRIDGYAPTTYNVATGHYGNWVEASLNVSSSVPLSASATALFNSMKTGFNSPAVLSGLNNGFNTSALLQLSDATAQAGILAPANSRTTAPANPATKAATYATPVAYFTHNSNTCQPPLQRWSTGTSN